MIQGSASTTFCGIEKEKVEPSPYTLSAEISPFIRLTNCLLMASPRPVPSILRFRLLSICWKDLNSLPISSGLMPIPVSDTENNRLMVSAETVS